MTEKIQLNTSQKQERAQQVALEQAERQRRAALATLAEGELEVRNLTLDAPITVEGYDGSYRTWVLFGGQREALWTRYTAEPQSGPSDFVRTSIPRLHVEVVDFARPYYSSTLGTKKIDGIVGEIKRVMELDSEHVIKVYGVRRDLSPKGWERLMILVERDTEGGKLGSWLPIEGYGEVLASVSYQ